MIFDIDDHRLRTSVPIVGTLIGFFLTTSAFYPGTLSPDSIDILNQAISRSFDDWHSPFFSYLISLLAPSSWGPALIFLIINLVFWLCFYLLVRMAESRYGFYGLFLLLAPFSPALFFIPAWIWDLSFSASIWLLAISLVLYRTTKSEGGYACSIVALVCIVFGLLSRINGWFATIPLFYIALPVSFKKLTRICI